MVLRMKSRNRVVWILFTFFSLSLPGQNVTFIGFLGGGVSTLENGWSMDGGFALETKNNLITLSGSYQSETGNRQRGFFLIPEFYNDHFAEVSLMYGRVFKPNNWFQPSASIGPSMGVYIDKYLGGRTPGFFSTPTIEKRSYSTLGLALKGDLLFICTDGFGLGQVFHGCESRMVLL